MNNPLYECTIVGSPTGRDHKTYTVCMRHSEIISLARDEASRNGGSLEDFAGIPLVCADESVPVEDREYDYEHYLTGEEEFQAALDWYRRDGATFEIKEGKFDLVKIID